MHTPTLSVMLYYTTQHNICLLVPGTVELRCFTGRTAPTCRLSSRPYSSHHAISQHLIGSRGLRVLSLPGILFLLHIAEHPWLCIALLPIFCVAMKVHVFIFYFIICTKKSPTRTWSSLQSKFKNHLASSALDPDLLLTLSSHRRLRRDKNLFQAHPTFPDTSEHYLCQLRQVGGGGSAPAGGGSALAGGEGVSSGGGGGGGRPPRDQRLSCPHTGTSFLSDNLNLPPPPVFFAALCAHWSPRTWFGPAGNSANCHHYTVYVYIHARENY